jgi:capsular exopolysaccharide synthesis family protein
MELRHYLTLVQRWWWLIILLTVVAAATSYAVSQRQPRVYEATSTLLVGQAIQVTNLDSRDLVTSEQLALTYAEIARRQPVLQGVVETLNLADSWQGLKKRVEVKPVGATRLLETTVEARSPEEARATADELAHQLILLSPTALQNQAEDANQQIVRQRLDSLQAKIEAGQARLEELEAAMAGSLSADQVQDLQSEINTLERLIADWENNHTQLLIFILGETSPNYLTVIESAQAISKPIRPRVLTNTVVAGVLGFLLAGSLIFLLEYLDDTLKTTSDITTVLDLTPLGAISQIKGNRYSDMLIALQDPFTPVSEAYRMVRSNIQFMAVDTPAKTIMVTSPTPGEGKSTTAANLGVVMAQAGLKTIVVDADLRRPVQHEIFQVTNLAGLTDLLRSPKLEVNGHLRETQIENLQVITCGVIPPNPSELLGSQRMGQLLASLSEAADVVIFDTPPAIAVTDAAVLSNRVDGVVLVTEAGQTRRELAHQAVSNLRQAGAKMFGVILNRVSDKSGSYYYHYYSGNGHRSGKPKA